MAKTKRGWGRVLEDSIFIERKETSVPKMEALGDMKTASEATKVEFACL